jgi:hypothetical protein
LECTSIGKGSVHPSSIRIVVILVADNSLIQIGRSGATLRDLGIRISWLEVARIGT